MIHRGTGFHTVVWFGSTPTPLPTSPVSKLSLFLSLPVYVWGRAYWWGGGGGECGAESYNSKKPWPSINRSILSAFNHQNRWAVGKIPHASRFSGLIILLSAADHGWHIWCYKVHGSLSVFFIKKPPSPVRKRSRDGQGLLNLCQVLGSLGHLDGKIVCFLGARTHLNLLSKFQRDTRKSIGQVVFMFVRFTNGLLCYTQYQIMPVWITLFEDKLSPGFQTPVHFHWYVYS